MFKTIPGPNRDRLGFKEQALKYFTFLIDVYGFHCVTAKVTFVRFESQKVFVNIYHGRASYEIEFEIGLLTSNGKKERSITSSAFLELIGCKEKADKPFWQANTKEGIEKGIAKMAAFIRQHATKALQGDIPTFETLFSIQKQSWDRHLEGMKLQNIREKANEAWKFKDYAKLVELFEPVKCELKPAEVKKLEYAKKRL